MAQATHVTDVAIIGAGPVGLFAVFECGMLKMSAVVVDTLVGAALATTQRATAFAAASFGK